MSGYREEKKRRKTENKFYFISALSNKIFIIKYFFKMENKLYVFIIVLFKSILLQKSV